ncbi:MAG: TraM recognition domain-containing protein [Pseudomonadota bacterium]
MSPADLVRQRAVVFLCGTQRNVRRLGTYYSLLINCFLDCLYSEVGPVTFIGEEVTNAPLQAYVDALTTIRGPGGEAHNVAQSRVAIKKKFGEEADDIIDENAVTKIWMSITGLAEAKRVLEMMGEELAVQENLGADNTSHRLQSNLSLVKQRIMSPAQLLALPSHQMLVHVRGIGFFVLDKISQNNIGPYHELAGTNEVERGKLPYLPKLILPLPPEANGGGAS